MNETFLISCRVNPLRAPCRVSAGHRSPSQGHRHCNKDSADDGSVTSARARTKPRLRPNTLPTRHAESSAGVDSPCEHF